MKVSLTSTLDLGVAVAMAITTAGAGPLDPDCTAEKAATSAAAKATVRVGGRCSPKEAAADSAKDAANIDDKDRKDNDKKDKDKKDK